MTQNQMLIGLFLLSCASRVRGCVRRWNQPVVRGPEWFFNVGVQPGFYTGPGRKILRDYRLRMFIPIAAETLLAAAIFFSGKISWLYWLIIAAALAVHVNHLLSVQLAERQARKFAVPEAEQPVSSVVLSLTPRRLRDYTNRRTEQFIILATAGVIAWLVRYYFQSPAEHNLRLVFAAPALLLYSQIGLLFVKYGIVAWRTPIPQVQAEEHLQAREETRKLHLKVCDWIRLIFTAQLIVWPVLLVVPLAMKPRLAALSWVVFLLAAIMLAVFQEMGRHSVLKAMVRARPVKMPDFLHTENSSWPVCFQPDTPTLLVQAAHGYSLNLANKLTQMGAAYVAGLITLVVLLRMGH